MDEKLFEKLSSRFPLTALNAGEFARMKVSGLTFDVKHYRAEGLGHVSEMHASGFFGLMKMDTLVINPFVCDAPLFSYDRILAMGNDTLYVECYNTMIGNSYRLEPLEMIAAREKGKFDQPDKSYWYDDLICGIFVHKKGKKTESAYFDGMFGEALSAYLDGCAACESVRTNPDFDVSAKRARAAAYSDGLLTHGGPATDVFLKKFGPEKTRRFFETVFFGTGMEL